jgi:hypothetical protein
MQIEKKQFKMEFLKENSYNNQFTVELFYFSDTPASQKTQKHEIYTKCFGELWSFGELVALR